MSHLSNLGIVEKPSCPCHAYPCGFGAYTESTLMYFLYPSRPGTWRQHSALMFSRYDSTMIFTSHKEMLSYLLKAPRRDCKLNTGEEENHNDVETEITERRGQKQQRCCVRQLLLFQMKSAVKPLFCWAFWADGPWNIMRTQLGKCWKQNNFV